MMSNYNWFLNRIVLPVGDILVGGNYINYLKKWKQFDLKTEEELQNIQTDKLRNVLEFAIKNIPFYSKIESPKIDAFPILTKSILRENTSALVSCKEDLSKLKKHHSSGSSGVQSFTYMTQDHEFYLRALQTHWWTWSGYELGDHLLQFGISQKRSFLKRLKDIFYRCTYVKAFGLSEMELKDVLNKVSNKKNLVIAGYPSVINQLALASLKENIKLNTKSIVCFGDKLFTHYEKNMISAFGEKVKIVDTYGCAEGLLMACKDNSNYYNIMSPHVYIEIVDDSGKAVEDGEMGNVLVTCLTNMAMPLIRYQLGDLAIKLPKDEYPKNREKNYPLLERIIGRETDIVKTTKGITLNVHSFTGVLEYYQTIKQYKVIQNDLNGIIIEYIVENETLFDQTIIDEIRTKLNELTHNCLDISFKRVEIIKPSASGKPQIIESNLS